MGKRNVSVGASSAGMQDDSVLQSTAEMTASGPKFVKPRRNLSVSDMNARRGSRLRQSSLSDLTDETSSPQSLDEPLHELEFQIKYCELVTIAGVSDIPEFCPFGEEYDPPSAPCAGHYTGSFSVKSKPPASVILSLHFPHKLLIVTQGFCNLFKYTTDSEICGRALKTLYGPRTDSGAIESGIHSVAMNEVTCHTIVLYNRDGEGVQVKALFTPYLSDAETLAGCLLELTPTNA
jgi:hypothetical protein